VGGGPGSVLCMHMEYRSWLAGFNSNCEIVYISLSTDMQHFEFGMTQSEFLRVSHKSESPLHISQDGSKLTSK